MNNRLISSLLLAALLVLPATLQGAEDAEEATHDKSAAFVQVLDSYDFSGFKVIQFDLGVLAHYSYLLISEGKALLVDPLRDIKAYEEAANKGGFKIVGTFLTHNHADFVAGHMEAAKALGAPIYISEQAGVGFKHTALNEKSELKIGKARLRFIATPGHTPESMCAVVYGEKDSQTPEIMFTGDTLFVGSVGRPDLMGGSISAAALASMMFDTWTKKLSPLADSIKIFPAHGAGSLCGAGLSDEPYSTLGEQKKSNPYTQHKSRSEFIAAILDGLPQAPQYFGHNAAMNKKGPALVDWQKMPKLVPPSKTLITDKDYVLIDLREAAEYSKSHVPNSINVALRGRVETWIGVMVQWGKKVILIGSEEEKKEAVRRLHRIGYVVEGLLEMDKWQKAGLPVKSSGRIPPKELYEQVKKGTAPVIVDVRLPNEWMAARIGTVVNLPLNELAEKSAKLDKSQPVVTVCNSAFRSSLALGILEREGFTNVSSLDGGGKAWKKAGLPMLQSSASKGATSLAKRSISLPEQVSASQLKRTLMDLPTTIDVVDIRPSEHFADYSIAGSRNVDVVQVLSDKSFLAGSVPLVLVCRDGSISMAVGGALAQKTERPIKVLYGGLESFWQETNAPSPSPSSVGNKTPVKPVVPQKPQKRRRRSAGC